MPIEITHRLGVETSYIGFILKRRTLLSTTYVYAISENRTSIHISAAERGSHSYFCRYCGNSMIARKGTVKSHHFAHKSKCNCDPWYHGKGEWHREMQDLFPKEYQEVILESEGEKHIADVCIPKPNGQRLVIEFQDSPMSNEEFITRTLFWKSNNSDMIWVFNLLGKDIREFPNANERDVLAYEWKRSFFTLGNKFIEGVPIIFYIKPTIRTVYKRYTYAGYFEERIAIEGREGFPMFVRLTGNGNNFEIHANIDDEEVTIHRNGYSMFKGERCYSLKQFVSDRLNYFSDEPFIWYEHQIWVAFPSRTDIPKEMLLTVSEQEQKINESSFMNAYPINVYVRKEDAFFQTKIYVDSETNFIKSFTAQYGEENIELIDPNRND